MATGLELDGGLAGAVGDAEALVVGAGLDEPDVLEAGPQPTRTTANDKATTKDRDGTRAVFMICI